MKKYLKFALVALTICIGFVMTSCSDEPSATKGSITITNKTNYHLPSFTVFFTNNKGEVITYEEKGTLKSGDKIKVEYPIGTTDYYMGTYFYGAVYMSAGYDISVKRQILTDEIIGHWTKVQ